MDIKVYEMGENGGLVRVDVPDNHRKNNLPLGTVLHWGGNMGWRAQDYAIVGRREGSFGVYYDCISLETFSRHSTEARHLKDDSDKVWHGQHFFIQPQILTPAEMTQLKQRADAAEARGKEIAEAKAETKRRTIEKHKADNPHLQQTGDQIRGATLAAKNIRTELKKAFPAVKFSVRSEHYSGGNSVNIKWTDGPTSEEVTKITGKYEEGSFDGMTDSYNYDSDRTWPDVFGGAKYVMEHRSLSDEALNKTAALLGFTEAKYIPNTGDFSGVDYETSRMIVREAYKTAF